MTYDYKTETIQKIEHLKQIPEEELSKMRKILNDYISKNRRKHINFLKKSLMSRIGLMLTDEIVEDILQKIYEYAWINIETVMEFHKTGYLDRYFNSLFYNPSTTKNARLRLGRDIHTPIIDDSNPYEEDDMFYTNYALDPHAPLEERLEYHKIALDETKNWLWDNPHSNLKKALDIQKKRHGLNGYNVALNYVATPSYKFLYDNYERLNLANVYHCIKYFKEVCSEVYGKEVLQGSIFPYTKYI